MKSTLPQAENLALAPAPLFGVWQAIATAPRDGEVFLVYCPHSAGGYQFTALIDTAGQLKCMMSADKITQATHWTPLPLPPNVKNQAP